MALAKARSLDGLRLAVAYAWLALALFSPGPAQAKTALEHLREAPKPRFREGHTLLPLTRWGWTMPYEVRVELAEHWGYALEFGGYADSSLAKELDNPNSIPSRLCALTASDPRRYPLSVLASREFPKDLPEETWCHDAQGKLLEGRQIWSPEAPDEVFEKAGALMAEPLKKIREKAPIAIILNGGEYALGVYAHQGKLWMQDPKVVKAKGERPWHEYVAARKAHQELLITKAIRRAIPDRRLYVYYFTDGIPYRYTSPPTDAVHYPRYPDSTWWQWGWGYEWMRHVSDIASGELYYRHRNSGWSGEVDGLSKVLNAVAQQISLGEPLSYNWLCAGWTRTGKEQWAAQEGRQTEADGFSDAAHYMGFLKCWYTAGMIGGVAGYFAYPPGGFGAELGDEPPSWLWQMMVQARAHALFSHLEEFLREGCLLPGPDAHRWSRDLPAYEFPTGDPNVRVLARKHRERPEWLITAWAAEGQDRQVAVTIPELGQVTLLARACGSVYRARIQDGKVALTLLDEDGMLPTANLPQ